MQAVSGGGGNVDCTVGRGVDGHMTDMSSIYRREALRENIT